MTGVIVFSVTLFLLCYRFDNKYAMIDPQPENGILVLEEEMLIRNPVVFLTQDWEIYRGRLLAPADFTANSRPDEYVYIGQYGGFEGDSIQSSPHGCATYRLNIVLPPDPASYTLELPEIYSAYTLYINGVRTEQYGNPALEGYRPETGHSSVSFLAQNRVEIIVAVSDYSHMYSGMVYPPAFGVSPAVSAMIQTRLTVRTAICSIALALALLFLTMGYLMKKERSMLLFGAICFCFTGYVCYPVVKTIFRSGMWWYGFENFCFCAMLLLVIMLQRVISDDHRKLSLEIAGIGVLVCACSLLRAFLPSVGLSLIAGYSLMIGLYKWAVAFYLTSSIIRSPGQNIVYGYTLLAGIVVFDCAMVMDRLFPLFEPIRFGWFSEIGGFAIVLTLAAVVGQEALRHYREKLALEGRIAGIESLVEMQRAYYPVILESVEEARRARHDLRHHVSVIQGLVLSGNHKELESYVQEYAAGIAGLKPLVYCENHIMDVILRHFAVLTEQEGVDFRVHAGIPDTLPVDNADLCILVGNLLENALEACAYVAGEKRITVTVKQIRNNLVILVDNNFDGKITEKAGVLASRKGRNRIGKGLASIQAVATKYGGEAEYNPDQENKQFTSQVIIPINQQ